METGAHSRDADWQVNSMAPALQENHDDCVMNPESCHMTLSKMYKDSQSASDRKALKEEKEAADETATSMEDKMRNKKKKPSPLDGVDIKWLAIGLAAAYFLRR